MPTHRYVTNGVERSRSAWYCLCILEVCAETAAKGVWSGSVASIVYSVRVLDSRIRRGGGRPRGYWIGKRDCIVDASRRDEQVAARTDRELRRKRDGACWIWSRREMVVVKSVSSALFALA